MHIMSHHGMEYLAAESAELSHISALVLKRTNLISAAPLRHYSVATATYMIDALLQRVDPPPRPLSSYPRSSPLIRFVSLLVSHSAVRTKASM